MKREKSVRQRTDPCGAPRQGRKNHASTLVREKRSSPSNKVSGKGRRNKFVEKSWMLDRNKSFKKVDSSKNCPRARLAYVKIIGNGLRTIKNVMKSGTNQGENRPGVKRE